MPETHMDRLINERDELKEKFDKLNSLILSSSSSYDNLSSDDQFLLLQQRLAMRTYLNILNRRVES